MATQQEIIEVLARHGIKIIAANREFVTIHLEDGQTQQLIAGLAAKGCEARILGDGSILVAAAGDPELEQCKPLA